VESVALLGKTDLFNKTPHAGVFSDVIFRLLWAKSVPPRSKQWLLEGLGAEAASS
jgi:hypothetical protein